VPDVRAIGIHVARVRGQLDRRAHLVADQMDGIEVMRQADEIAVIGKVARPAPPLAIVDVGWSRHQPEIDVIASKGNLSGGIAWSQREGARRPRERLRHQPAIDANHAAGVVDLSACGPHDVARLLRPQFDTELLENAQRGEMNGLELIGREDFHRRERISDRPPGQLPQMAGDRTAAPPPFASSTGFHRRIITQAFRPRLRKADTANAPVRLGRPGNLLPPQPAAPRTSKCSRRWPARRRVSLDRSGYYRTRWPSCS